MYLIKAENVCKNFNNITALNNISFSIKRNSLTTIVGPDGAGKTTLLRIIANLLSINSGSLKVFDIEHMQNQSYIHEHISYMPQKFGLYEDLSVQENIDLYASMYGITLEEQTEKQAELLDMTGLKGFEDRLAGKLSGGMKQKLALTCSLLHIPEILLLDEPTVGVDPLSRKELWVIIDRLIIKNNLTVVVSTAYMDEAEKADRVIMLNNGSIISDSTPEELSDKAKGVSYKASSSELSTRELIDLISEDTGTFDFAPSGGAVRFLSKDISKLPSGIITSVPPTVEDGFISILGKSNKREPFEKKRIKDNELMIEAKELTKRFGNFIAVDNTSFTVKKGEIFGLLGPNGAGKTTTFRMMCGLITPTSGTLKVAGIDAKEAALEVRKKLGYMAQKFSLYGELSVLENLEFFAGTYNLKGEHKKSRIAKILTEFDLVDVQKRSTHMLPLGIKQRLSMAVALVHTPDILFLDEPTSGADPLARREFWNKIMELSDKGTTVIVTTHFMEEAEYCDRLMIQDRGQMLAIGTPDEIRKNAAFNGDIINNMQEAFISIVKSKRGEAV